jgi:HlyD family secretion protein
VEPLAFTKVSTLGVEEQRVLVLVDPADPAEDWSRLGDGFRVLARFILWEAKDVLQAPTSALFRFDAGWAVFVYENGLAVRRPVQPGRRQGLRTQIVEGLKEGDRVVSRPDDRVAHDARIRVEP